MTPGTVTFAGAGPGAVDLLTLRCRDAIAEADAIVYAGSLVNPEVLQFARQDAARHDSAGMTLAETTRILAEAWRAGRKALRLHTGDPSMYGAIAEQIAELRKLDIAAEVIPGVSSVFAAAAAVGCELTVPSVSQTLILTRRAGRTPVPPGQDIPALAAHRATLGIFLSVADMEGLVRELLAGGYPPATPVAVVYRASWPDERRVRGTLADMAATVREAGIRRQAIVLVGDALSGQGEPSRLYAPDFTHGYRAARTAASGPEAPESSSAAPGDAPGQPAADPPFLGRIAVYALTDAGSRLARRIGAALPCDLFLSNKHADDANAFDPVRLREELAGRWSNYDAHVLIMAAGIAVRKTAALLTDKTRDPAVVVCDEGGRFVISLVGGHIAGANRLSRQLARVIGGVPVVTTATDAQGIPAFDELAALQGWHIVNRDAVKHINSALLQKRPIGFIGPPAPIQRGYGDDGPVRVLAPGTPVPPELAALAVLDGEAPPAPAELPILRLRSRELVVGIGCRRGASAAEIAAAVDATLADYALAPERVSALASATLKADERGLTALATQRQLPLKLFDAETLAAQTVPTPSAMPAKHVGTPSVCEAAAQLAAGGRLLVPKQVRGKVTVAVAACGAAIAPDAQDTHTPRRGRIYAVGIGSGAADAMIPRARQALEDADVIVGYKVYCDQIRPLIAGKQLMASGMRQEVQRCRAAIAEARAGRTVAVIGSGDAGVYGMAGLLMELIAESDSPPIEVEVVPGITAALEAAAALGAPLMNDFAVISLSDLLTERTTILKRLDAVARAGMPCALYNPRSRKRTDVLDAALRIFRAAGGDHLACGYVRHAGRAEETRWAGRLADLPVTQVDMFTTVIVGGADTTILNGRLVTRRGYRKG